MRVVEIGCMAKESGRLDNTVRELWDVFVEPREGFILYRPRDSSDRGRVWTTNV